MPLFLALVLLILAEISLYVTLGAAIGLPATLAEVVGSAVLGVLIIRAQGQRVIERLMQTAMARKNPLREAGDGMLKAVAGVFLFLPGFLTDAVGLVLLLPPVRRWIINRIAREARRHAAELAMEAMLSPHRHSNPGASDGHGGSTGGTADGEVIEGEAEEVPPSGSKRGSSGWTRRGK